MPTQSQILAQLERMARRWEPALRDAFLAAIRSARQQTTLELISQAMAQADPGTALREGMRGLEFTQMRETLAQIVEASGNVGTNALSAELGDIHGRFLASFDITNPYAAQYARTEVGAMIREVTNSTQEGVRRLIENSVEGNLTVYDTARQIRDMVGLTSQQVDWVTNYQNQLIIDGVANVDERTARYAERVLRYRALMIARTETIDALNAGQQAAWRSALDQGWLTGDEQQVWIVGPNACEAVCDPTDGQQVGLNEYFTLGDDSQVLRPPAHPNCRCTVGLIT